MCAAALFFMMTGGLVLAADTTEAEPVQAVAAATQTKAKTAQAAPVQQTYSLDLDTTKYEKKTMTVDGKKVAFRAYENRVYVAHPVDTTYQSMNIYVPEGYFNGKTINGYTAKTAPIFLPNTVGGYMPGAPGQPSENDRMTGGANAMLVALSKGYVVAAPGARGRRTQAADGTYTGKAPALKALGAADERDDIYASSVYCPITDLDHADMAYEWMFNGVNTYHQGNMGAMKPPAGNSQAKPAGVVTNRPDNAPVEAAAGTEMTAVQQQASKDLKAMYPAYINSLHLVDKNGKALTLDENGRGSFADYIKSIYMASAQKALDNGTDLSSKTWLTINDGKVTDMDLAGYAVDVTRLKAAPAFDALDMSSAETEEFGTATVDKQHFTVYGKDHSTIAGSALADKDIVKTMNPLNYIGKSGVKTAHYWRIRHGEADRDTTIAVPAVVALRLQQAGYDVDFASPWARGHAGDYDLDELFAWMDAIGHKN